MKPESREPHADPDRLGSGRMFDAIADKYDVVNRVISLGMDQSWRRRAVRALELDIGASGRDERAVGHDGAASGPKPRRDERAVGHDGAASGPKPRRDERALRPAPPLSPGATVLDLATGTADLAILIARTVEGARVIGVDPSEGMLAVGRKKVAEAGLANRIDLRAGDAQALDLPDRSVDGVTIAFGIRNVPDRPRALREMARVTRPGGRVAILELSEPREGPMGALARFYVRGVVPRVGGTLSGKREYRYLQESIAAFPPPDEFAATMREAGLRVIEVTPLMFGAAVLFVATPEV